MVMTSWWGYGTAAPARRVKLNQRARRILPFRSRLLLQRRLRRGQSAGAGYFFPGASFFWPGARYLTAFLAARSISSAVIRTTVLAVTRPV